MHLLNNVIKIFLSYFWLDCQGPLFFKKVDIQGKNNKIEVTVENFFPKIYMAII